MAQLEPAGLRNGDTKAVAKAVLARAIVEAAEQGERHADKLAAYAISHYPQTPERLRSRGLSNDSAASPVK